MNNSTSFKLSDDDIIQSNDLFVRHFSTSFPSWIGKTVKELQVNYPLFDVYRKSESSSSPLDKDTDYIIPNSDTSLDALHKKIDELAKKVDVLTNASNDVIIKADKVIETAPTPVQFVLDKAKVAAWTVHINSLQNPDSLIYVETDISKEEYSEFLNFSEMSGNTCYIFNNEIIISVNREGSFHKVRIYCTGETTTTWVNDLKILKEKFNLKIYSENLKKISNAINSVVEIISS